MSTRKKYPLTNARVFPLIALLALSALLLLAPPAYAQQTMQMNNKVTIDKLGDSVFTIRTVFTAAQFQQWQQRYGSNPALFRRDATRPLNAYEISDFQVDKNDMERSVEITVKAKGVALYKGDGRFQLDLPKTWQLIDLDENVLKFTEVQTLGPGATMMSSITVNLPDSASDISEPVAVGPGDIRINYQLPVAGKPATLLYAGSAAAVIGLALMITGFFFTPNRAKPAAE